MKLKIIWQATGDELLFDITNKEFVKWFVEISQQRGNRYSVGDQIIDQISAPKNTQSLIDEEIKYIDTVNTALASLKMPIFAKPDNWYDQRQLNTLHKEWSKTKLKWPRLTELLYKLDKKLFEAYQEMNCHIHLIESSFVYSFRDQTNWRVPNPFKDQYFPWESSNLYVKYPGHGRFAFEKFVNLDVYDDILDDDCNWDNVDAYIGMNFRRPYQKTPTTEFLNWCKEKNLVPFDGTISLGNLADWEHSLTTARQVNEKNVNITDNYFSLLLT
jgi:hypothetical protein